VYRKNNNMTTLKQAGRELKLLRIAAGLNQAELADQLGLHINTISNIERGRNWNHATAARYAEYFGASIEIILKKSA